MSLKKTQNYVTVPVQAHVQAWVLALTAFGLCALMTAPSALAVELPSSTAFLQTELAITGSSPSSLWRSGGAFHGLALDQIGGQRNIQPDEFGGGAEVPNEEDKIADAGPSITGTKVKAGLYSAILPGAGQFYNGQKKKAYIMAGAEVAIWTAYFVFDAQGNSRMDDAQEYARIYAGTSNEHAESYWQSVGRYLDSDTYNDSRRREARALQEELSGLVYGSDTWQWVNEDRQTDYRVLRADANTAYDHRDFMILFAVVNRVISVVDAVLGAGNKPGALETEVLGMKLGVEVLPSWHNPGAQCVVSRSF